MRDARRARCVLVAVALAASVAAGCGRVGSAGSGTPATGSVPPPKLPLAGKVVPPATGAYLGVFEPPAPFDTTALDRFETRAGKGVSIVMWYQQWATASRYRFDAAACVAAWRRGAVPMITWEPWDPGRVSHRLADPAAQPAYRLAEIVSGRYDAYIRGWARDIRALGAPVMLRPMHEMNGNWYPWAGTVNGNTPADFVAAWRHVHDIFTREGASNVTWVWSVNHDSVPHTAANSYAAYYPGDAYVDWTAISGFNWGTSLGSSRWRSFSFWYDPPLAYLKTIGKPICIAEFGSVEQGGSKAAWLADAYARVESIPAVKAIVYYDAKETALTGTQDWRFDTSPASLAAFRRAIAPPYFVGAASAALATWGAGLTPDQWQYLSALPPVYR